jgi:hypothetical protein
VDDGASSARDVLLEVSMPISRLTKLRVASVLAGGVLAAGGGYYAGTWPASSPAEAAATGAPGPPVADDTLRDPLAPDRPPTRDAARQTVDASWVSARPQFQYSRTAAERGGVEPCATQAVDVSALDDWVALSKGRFTAPRDLQLDASGRFDLVLHLHGDEPARRELALSRQPFVLYALSIDPSQSYASLFSGTGLHRALLAELEAKVSQRLGREARVGNVALSAWSAGFAGVGAILAQPDTKADAVILIDGLHAPRDDRFAFEAQLKPFADYAEQAAHGRGFMLVSHSSIDPPGFASTTECAHYLVAKLAGKPEPVSRGDAMGLELVEYFSQQGFHVRGYAGNDKPDHCAQLALLRDVFVALGQRWNR